MLPPITSLQNPRVKQAVRLRDRSGRDDQGLIIIDGPREIERALAAGVRLRELFIQADILPPDVEQQLAHQARACDADVLDVTSAVMEKISFGDRKAGVVATAEPPTPTMADLQAKLAKLKKPPLILVLEAVEKPGNLGAVLRTADAAGINGLIVCDGRTDLYNPNAIRASLGAIFTVPLATASAPETIAFLQQQKMSIFTARVDGAVNYTAVDYRPASAIVLGSEMAGLTSAWQATNMQAIRLPMLGQVDSLNVSVTAAIVCYEALRQRSA
ncbi:23S rRNA (adenosine(1067)-2'-O)-methyltransferase [Anatilimnocola aggregata]|uniref:23S rRNA (Adenosine(1067)-2'-O)-methyltransferase n=1 Tax=Anatilimnocola aggregata TaxID=2528021 RepID=A0A517YMP4_9BACT|nr:RNA methyltransferase [Anatilimnocola aggregata]QDU31492.1 23S rRNA (adenosine(1067)-2'-O)-methyltransferase [Anatilimnocola aggregata]